MDRVQHEARYIARRLALDADTLAKRRARLNLVDSELILLGRLHSHMDDGFFRNLFDTMAQPLGTCLPGGIDVQSLKPLLLSFFQGLTGGDFGPDHAVDRLRLGLLLERAELPPTWLPAAYGYYLDLLTPRLNRLFDQPQAAAVYQGLIKAILLDMGLILESFMNFRPSSEPQHQGQDVFLSRDPLTRLPSRNLFYYLLDQSLKRAHRHQRVVAVMFVDLDGFRRINERQGYETGDQVLEAVANRLSSCLRSNDVVARLGSDEFAILLEDITLSKDVSRVVNKILRTLAVPLDIAGQHLFLTTSIGISLFPLDGSDPQALLRLADSAMQQVKAQGGNSYRYYSRDLDHDSLYRSNLARLGDALEQQEFLLQYQPVAAVRDLSLRSIEVLLRWNHPERGLLHPQAFLHILEENGLIVPVGRWVLSQACRQAQNWRRSGYRFATITVNLSPQQFRDPGLVSCVRETLQETGLPPEQLELEISESTLTKSLHLSIHTLRELANLGVRLSLDDFGTDGASLSHLIRLPLHTLKIDRCFVQDAPDLLQDATLTHAAIALGQSLGLTVVAEGVETGEQLQFLRDRHCDAFQGYYLCRPLDGAGMTAFLKQDHLGKSSQQSLH